MNSETRGGQSPPSRTSNPSESLQSGSDNTASKVHPGMPADEYLDIKQTLIDIGYGHEIEWATNLKPVERPVDFLCEFTWVVLNSGMKNQVAEKIWQRIQEAWSHDRPISEVFGHKGKVAAIEYVRVNVSEIFRSFKQAQRLGSEHALDFLESLPWIGKITKYHLAKNLGMDIAKPDRHLVRIANSYGESPSSLCRKLSQATGDRVALVDLVIWRACNLGLLSSRSRPSGE